MALPFFYSEEIIPQAKAHELNEESSRHIVQVLRMKSGEKLNITNGKGYVFFAEITGDHKKKVSVSILDSSFSSPPPGNVSIAISLIKNAARFEWFLEKATEIGVSNIIPLLCKRTEKQHFRADRMKNILTSAMLQSQQAWLPALSEPVKYDAFVAKEHKGQKFIAHCEDQSSKTALVSHKPYKNPLIIIGPEGDLTKEEITAAISNGFTPVALGDTRLRTETAGIVAVSLLNIY